MINLFFESIRVAQVAVTDKRASLVYDPDWLANANAFPVSLTMPLGPEPVAHDRIVPWLANLLPESHLSEIGQQIGVSPQDVLGLLTRIGRDTAGALSVGTPRDAQDSYRQVKTTADLERIITELPQKPFLVGEHGVSMSLAGVQDKLPVAVVDGRIVIPLDGTPSTHILKPDTARLPASVHNEAFCLKLAQLAGLDVASAETGKAGQRLYLLVSRYDRIATDASRVTRIHQEDFCQLLGYFPSAKYEAASALAGGGPTLKDMFGGLNRYVSPGARLLLLDGVIFNVLIGNTDTHAKNYSILIGAAGGAKLAPLYDLMCGDIYPAVTRTLAQRINGRSEAIHLHGRDWRQLARDVGLSPARTVQRVRDLCESVPQHVDAAMAFVASSPAGDHPLLGQIAKLVKKRCTRILKQLDQTDPNDVAV